MSLQMISVERINFIDLLWGSATICNTLTTISSLVVKSRQTSVKTFIHTRLWGEKTEFDWLNGFKTCNKPCFGGIYLIRQ